MKRLAEVKDSLDIEVKQNFIDPLQNLCDKDLKEIQVNTPVVFPPPPLPASWALWLLVHRAARLLWSGGNQGLAGVPCSVCVFSLQTLWYFLPAQRCCCCS